MQALLLTALVLGAAPWELASPPKGQFALDETKTLRADTLGTLDAIAKAIDDSGAGQLGVVVVQTTGGVAPRTFATNLFNHWGIGHAGRDDGVLLFLALKDRKAELIVGDGQPLSASDTDRIMRDEVIANLKRKDVDGAVLAAARSIQTGLQARVAEPPAAVRPATPEVDEELARYVRREKPLPERTPRAFVVDLADGLSASERADLEVLATELYADGKGRVVMLFVDSVAPWPPLVDLVDVLEEQLAAGGPTAIVALNRRTNSGVLRLPEGLVTGTWEANEVARVTNEMRAANGFVGLRLGARFAAQALRTGIPPRSMKQVIDEVRERGRQNLWAVFLVFGAGLAGLFTVGRRAMRNRPRVCETCMQPRERLSEVAEDAHLSMGQRTEERLGSVDYDVWYCGRCNDALVARYGALFTRYGQCTGCGFKAATSSSRTVTHATEYSTGLVEVTQRCSNCTHVGTSTRVTARIQRTSSSSSTRSSWSSSSSSRSSSSWGGGRSSGGGSSGSW